MKKARPSNATVNLRLIAGLVVLLGAAALGQQSKNQQNYLPINIRTIGAAIESCNERSLETVAGRLGCSNVSGARTNGSVRILRAD